MPHCGAGDFKVVQTSTRDTAQAHAALTGASDDIKNPPERSGGFYRLPR
jgi:hypothetical protein